MSATHRIEVLDKGEKTITLRVYMLDAEVQELCLLPNCIVQMLWDKSSPAGKPAPIQTEITSEQRLDAKWLRLNHQYFIESVEVTGTSNYPPPEGFDFKRSGKAAEQLPQATLAVEVTDKRWISHIRRGTRWESAPFDASF